VGRYKQRNQMQVLDEQREKQVLDAKTALSDDPNMQFALTTLFETIMSISRKQQRQLVTERDPWYDRYQADRAAARAPLTRPRVLYQGEPGAYADEAAARFFGEDVPRDRVATWEEVFLALKEGRADYGVVPIENSSTGSINQVYDLLGRYGAYIVGEQTVKVDHCLMAPRGASLDSLTDVYSHEQGLSQCTEYLKQHPAWTGRAMLNTAAAAKYVAETGDVTKAAIGSRRAAGLYGLEVLAQGINFNADNYTRFVVVSPVMELRPQADKISALFTLPHRSGTLHRIMSIFAVAGLNMMKLESRPVLGKSWEYLFFVDFTGGLDQPGMDGVLHELTQASTSFRVLGNYKASGE
jgi:chorismate mutase/prephenate dehydratase